MWFMSSRIHSSHNMFIFCEMLKPLVSKCLLWNDKNESIECWEESKKYTTGMNICYGWCKYCKISFWIGNNIFIEKKFRNREHEEMRWNKDLSMEMFLGSFGAFVFLILMTCSYDNTKITSALLYLWFVNFIDEFVKWDGSDATQ